MINHTIDFKTESIRSSAQKDRIKLTLLVLPFILLVVAFNYVPLFGWIYSFFNYKPGISLYKTEFVGLANFYAMFSDLDLVRVLTNTVVLSFLIIISTPLPAVFAILLTEIRSAGFKKLVQTVTTLPNFISWIIVFSLAFTMFSNEGVLNQVVLRLNKQAQPLNILGNVNAVWFFQTLLYIWKTVGWNAIIYLAAIAGIDGELYDAAKVDGAGRFGSILHITIPGVIPTFFVLVILSISNFVSLGLDQYLVFYNSLVADKIMVLDLYVYRVGLVTNDIPYATAVGIFKTVISIILLISVNVASKKIRGNTII